MSIARKIEYSLTFLLLFSLIGIVIWGWVAFSSPAKPVNCNEAMQKWNYYEGQAAISAFKGDEISSKTLRKNYETLALKIAPSCFPQQLKDYLISNP